MKSLCVFAPGAVAAAAEVEVGPKVRRGGCDPFLPFVCTHLLSRGVRSGGGVGSSGEDRRVSSNKMDSPTPPPFPGVTQA